MPDFINLAPEQLRLASAPCRAALGSLLSSGVSLLHYAVRCKHDTGCRNTVTSDGMRVPKRSPLNHGC